MKTITGKVNAYMTKYSGIRIEDFKNPTADLISKIQYMTENDPPDSWTLIGKATITLDITNADAIVSNKVSALRAELQQHRADSHMTEQFLEEQIGKLLAINYEPQS